MGFEKYQPVALEDSSNEYKPVKGCYKCRVVELKRLQGTSERTGNDYDFYTLKLQVTESLDGDKATNRYLDSMMFNADQAGRNKLKDVLFSSGIEYVDDFDNEGNEQVQAFDDGLADAVDKTINVRAWYTPKMKKEGDGFVKVEPEEMKQRLKVVSQFKGLKIDAPIIPGKMEIPF